MLLLLLPEQPDGLVMTENFGGVLAEDGCDHSKKDSYYEPADADRHK